MSKIKTYLIISVLALAGTISFVQSETVSALTKAQETACREKWQGKTLDTKEKRDAFKASSCAKSGYCEIKSARGLDDDGKGAVVQRGQCGVEDPAPEPPTETPPGGGSAAPTECGDIKTSLVSCDTSGGDNPVLNMIKQLADFLAVGVGIAVVGGIVWGSLLYVTSNGESAKAQQGITVIVNAVLGLLLFIFAYAIIDFLTPGSGLL